MIPKVATVRCCSERNERVTSFADGQHYDVGGLRPDRARTQHWATGAGELTQSSSQRTQRVIY